jgi:tetratricopeptide (TPR) repeat protein
MAKWTRRRRWRWIGIGLIVIAVAAYPAWRKAQVAWYVHRAQTHLAVAEIGPGFAALVEADRLDPGRADLQFMLAGAARRGGSYEQMESYLERAERLSWPVSEIQRQRSLAIIQMGDTRRASQFVTEVMNRQLPDQDALEAYEALAKGYLASYRLKDAFFLMQHWIEWQPKAIPPRIQLAELWERRHSPARAAEFYREVLEIDPDHFQARLKLAVSLGDEQKVPEAIAEYERLLAAHPTNAALMMGLAVNKERIGAIEEAKRLFQAAVDSPEAASNEMLFHEGTHSLGRIALKENRVEEAVELLRKSVSLRPTDAGAHYSLGIALARAGQTDEAKREIQRSRELQELFEQIITLTLRVPQEPDNAELRWQVGEVLTRLEAHAEAVSWFKSALLADDQHRKSHEALLAHYEREGDARRANNHRLILEKLGPVPPPSAETGGEESSVQTPGETGAPTTASPGTVPPSDRAPAGETAEGAAPAASGELEAGTASGQAPITSGEPDPEGTSTGPPQASGT